MLTAAQFEYVTSLSIFWRISYFGFTLARIVITWPEFCGHIIIEKVSPVYSNQHKKVLVQP